MSSLTEKVLMIGFGATICLSLISAITPVLNQLQIESGASSNNRDILKFYQMITNIERNAKDSIQFPDQNFRIHDDFSKANSIQFSKLNATTLNVEMQIEDQIFVQIIEFEIIFTLWGNPVEKEFLKWTNPEDSKTPIEITFDLTQHNQILYFAF